MSTQLTDFEVFIAVDLRDLDPARAASPDAASPDAASPDAASPDAASPDAASPDAAQPDAPGETWKQTVAPFLARYTEALQQNGTAAAAEVFRYAPQRSGLDALDAAVAGLAEHLAVRDGWPVPPWAFEPGRTSATWWWVSRPRGPHASALMEAPTAFRSRRIFVTADDLRPAGG